jgi:hypothetical protein
MKVFKELSDVLFAVCLRIRLVEKLEHADKDFNRFLNHVYLDRWMVEELFENANGGSTELSVAKRN